MSTPNKVAALRALRATVVMPALFALTFKGFGNLQMGLFAAFGSFATLVLVSFSGTARNKLVAHATLAVAGSALIVIGTAVSSSIVLAAIVTVPVTFAVFFSGVTGPNAARGVTGALLAYILPAASPGTLGMIPDRLAGWWLASVIGTIAVLALPAPLAGDKVRAAVRKLTEALAEALEAAVRAAPAADLLALAIKAKRELLTSFSATPVRPTGLAISDQALADAVELAEWCTAVIADALREQPDWPDARDADRELLSESARALRETGAVLVDSGVRPDLERLDARRRAALAVVQSGWGQRPNPDEDTRVSFHAHTIATAVLAFGADALLAAELIDSEQFAEMRMRWLDAQHLARRTGAGWLRRYTGIAVRHATVRSVWFVNSLRGSLALAASVAVADASNVRHGFWVVLGTLSVLRTSSGATGETALRALLGTAIGFAVGAALLLVIGTSGPALWIALPLAVLLASYAPGVLPFEVGQAAFTVTVAVLFNLLVPVGWKVGELRIENVAIGCLVSVVVGALFWPRGVAPVIGDDLADAYRHGADYLRQAVGWVSGGVADAPSGGPAAVTAGLRLDEAVRGFLAEQGTKHLAREELWRLIGGTLRLRLTAHALAGMPRACATADSSSLKSVQSRGAVVVDGYEQLAACVARPARGRSEVLEPVFDGRDGARSDGWDVDPGDGGPNLDSRSAVWLREHLDHLAEHLEDLAAPATHLAKIRRLPWWR